MMDPPVVLPTLPPAEPAGDDEGPLDALPRLATLDDGDDDADAGDDVAAPIALSELHDHGEDTEAGDLVVAASSLPMAHADDAGESEGSGIGMEGGWAPAPLPSADGGEASDAEPLEALVAGALPALDADADGDADLAAELWPQPEDEPEPRGALVPWAEATRIAGSFTGLVATPAGLLAIGERVTRLEGAPGVVAETPVARALWCPGLGGLLLQGRSQLSVIDPAADDGPPAPLLGPTAAPPVPALLAAAGGGAGALVQRGATLAWLGPGGALTSLTPAFEVRARPASGDMAAVLVQGREGWGVAAFEPPSGWRLRSVPWSPPPRTVEAPLFAACAAGVALGHPGAGVTWCAEGEPPRPLRGTRGVTALALRASADGVELAVALVDDARGEVVVLTGDAAGPLTPLAVLSTPEGDPEPLRIEALAFGADGALLWSVGPAGARAWRRP